jgi:cobyrinic acid a,c-diamide synthase
MILEQASGNPVYQLDLWMTGEDDCRRLLYEAALDADLILIEGVMGLYDGKPSSADLAELFGLPVLLVVDASSMAQTFGAVAQGLATFRPTLPWAGVLANNVASERHAKMIKEDIPEALRFVGSIFRAEEIFFPSRHLGLIQAEEISDIDARLNRIADAVQSTSIDEILQEVPFSPRAEINFPALLDGITVAVARDRAFSFLYEANLKLLEKMGAKLIFFSPLQDRCLPATDSVYLPGGYPELYVDQLESNVDMKKALHQHFESHKPIYAECGGMLYLLDKLVDQRGKEGAMVGLIPGKAIMQSRLKSLGYQSAELPGGVVRGHTFHYSDVAVDLKPVNYGSRSYDSAQGEPIYRIDGLLASYLHFYFPSNPLVVANLFGSQQRSSTNPFCQVRF